MSKKGREKEKIAIFGGSFNPPHIGHYLIAKEIIKQYGIKKVIFVPAFLPPHKKKEELVDAKHREKMVKLLINNEKDLKYSNFELKKRGISYTIDTVRYFKKIYPKKEIYFIVGSDSFYFIDTWKDYKKLLNLIKFIVYIRKGFPKQKIMEKFPNIDILWAGYGLINIASTSIRKKIKKGIICKQEVGEKIWQYIVKNKLYV